MIDGWLRGIINSILTFFETLVTPLLLLLPQSPFVVLEDMSTLDAFRDIMGYINYFVPIGTFAAIMAGYLPAVLTYYAIRWILRWAKYID